MPHIAIEYSANLDGRIDVQALCDTVHAAALASGLFELGAIRVRAIRCAHYAIADRLPENAFVHAALRLGRGRSLAEKKAAGDAIFAAMTRFLAEENTRPHFAHSFEIVEIDGDLSWKSNAMHRRIRALAEQDRTA